MLESVRPGKLSKRTGKISSLFADLPKERALPKMGDLPRGLWNLTGNNALYRYRRKDGAQYGLVEKVFDDARRYHAFDVCRPRELQKLLRTNKPPFRRNCPGPNWYQPALSLRRIKIRSRSGLIRASPERWVVERAWLNLVYAGDLVGGEVENLWHGLLDPRHRKATGSSNNEAQRPVTVL